MPISYLEVENFKSYAGRQRIGPFHDFTAVIGPNGSGKSNLMDAISFVLGVQSRDLRSQQMRDLIFRAPGSELEQAAGAAGKKKAQQARSIAKSGIRSQVVLIYETPPRYAKSRRQQGRSSPSAVSNASHGSRSVESLPMETDHTDAQEDDDDDLRFSFAPSVEIRFGRRISPAGHSDYMINDRVVSFAEYEQRLAEIGVLLKARNFLVFQGDVESLARKSPIEMMTLFETISGSIEYKDDYERAKKAKDVAEEATMLAVRSQKAYRSERRLLKEQKEEADRFNELLKQKAAVQEERFLWVLYHLEQDKLAKEEEALEIHQESLEHKVMEGELAEQLKQMKKKASVARRLTTQLENKRLKAAANVDEFEPSLIEISEKIKHLERKLKSDQQDLNKARDSAAAHQGKIQSIEEEIAEYQQTMANEQAEYDQLKRDASGGDVQLTPEQEQEYEQLKQAAATDSAQARRLVGRRQRALDTLRRRAAQETQTLAEAELSLQYATQDVKELTERQDKLERSIEKNKIEIENTEKELIELQESDRQARTRLEQLDIELEKINVTLREANDERRQSKDEERLMQVVSTLKRNFTGVHGRLVDLCRPAQRKYNMAVTVAGGKDMDAIVVDTKQACLDCIRYLREQRIGIATFLPLDFLQTPSNDSTESLRLQISRDHRYRLAVDVINCDDTIRPAVKYAVGNTVVCDDLDSARELCFGSGARRVKAVTLSGSSISEAGSMTGGTTKEDHKKAGRWAGDDLEKLKEKKVQLESERAELDQFSPTTKGRRRRSLGQSTKLEELRNNLGSIKNRDEFSKKDLVYTKKQLQEKTTLLSSTEKEVAKLKKQMEQTELEIEKCKALVEEAIHGVKAAEDNHLGPFREATGLKDLKAYEEAIGKSRDEFNKKKRTLMEHITQLEQQRDYEARRDIKSPIARIENRIGQRKTALERASEEAKEIEQQVAKAKAQLEGAEAQVKEASDSEHVLEQEVQSAQSACVEAQAERARINKKLSSCESALETLRGKLHDTLQNARLEEVEIPMLDMYGQSQTAGLTRSQRKASRSSCDPIVEEGESDETEPGDLGGAESQTNTNSQYQTQESRSIVHFSQASDRVVVLDQKIASKVDFTCLRDSLKQRLAEGEARKMRKVFDERITKITADIEKITPNMKAGEAFGAVTQRLRESNVDYENAMEEFDKTVREFNQIKARRSELFNEAFDHIEAELKIIYTDMTKSSIHPLGGKAYLSVDDTNEPYNGGIRYNAMPPMKRFRDMEQLSGGEKTVAALALLFAIHSFHPAPFFVMDEIDAALDNVNLRKVCHYIKERSKGDVQCIVISLKDILYEEAQSLVGVCRDVGTSSSQTLTLDLTQFDQEDESPQSRHVPILGSPGSME